MTNERLQMIYDTVKNGITSQGGYSFDSSTDPGVNCMYRDGKGNKCAAGWLIPDDKYDPEFEDDTLAGWLHSVGGYLTDAEVTKFFINELGYSNEEVLFIGQLQSIHDDAAFFNTPLNEWRDDMKKIATEKGLTP
jgi:hypothetical protein